MNMNRNEKYIFSVGVIALLLSSAILFQVLGRNEDNTEINLYSKINSDINKISPTLSVEVRDSDGNLKNSFVKEDDLILDNFINFTTGIFSSNGATAVAMYMSDLGGAQRTFYAYHGGNGWSISTSGARGGLIGIGSGETTATRSDYALETQKETYKAVSTPSYSSGNITFTSTFSVTSGYNLSESVVVITFNDSGNVGRNVTVFRDTFANITVVAEDTVVITYTISLNDTGFTNNFGNLFVSMFSRVVSGGTTSFTATNIAGTTKTFYTWKTSGATISFAYANVAAKIAIGSSATATARTHYDVQTQVGSDTAISIPVKNSSSITIATSLVSPSAQTIQEASYMNSWIDSGGVTAEYVMLWRDTFTGVAVPEGNAITIVFTVTF